VLAELVAKVFHDSRGTYGCRRVAAELNRQGHPAGVGLIADLMRELELVACQPRSYKTTTIAGEEPVETPDLIEREFCAPLPGQRLVGDITSWVCRRVGISARRCSARVLVEPLAE
jgi:hypothetical protein